MRRTYQEVSVNKQRYIAVTGYGCEGCAFEKDAAGCWDNKSACSSLKRTDNRSVIWIKKPTEELVKL